MFRYNINQISCSSVIECWGIRIIASQSRYSLSNLKSKHHRSRSKDSMGGYSDREFHNNLSYIAILCLRCRLSFHKPSTQESRKFTILFNWKSLCFCGSPFNPGSTREIKTIQKPFQIQNLWTWKLNLIGSTFFSLNIVK